MINEISVQELQDLRESGADIVIVHVRDPWEHDICNLGDLLIPLKELPNRLNELNRDKHIIVHCQMGGRSSRATAYLQEQGFKQVSNLRGGIKAWAAEKSTPT